jgi:hypothetical protein
MTLKTLEYIQASNNVYKMKKFKKSNQMNLI